MSKVPEKIYARLNTMEVALRDLTRKILGLRDEERRRLAGELHDTTGQNLAFLIMDLNLLNNDIECLSPAARDRFSRCVALARQSLTEIRTLSYELYPPMLDECGVNSALRIFAQGFSDRSGVGVDLELPQSQRLPKNVEVAIFRVVQEALTNVHRHSNSSSARVRIKNGSYTSENGRST